jgi:hypothetical protein
MIWGQKLLLINLATSFYCVGAVWLAQLNWMLWRHVGVAEFQKYHQAWWHGIWWAIFPVAFCAVLGICLQLKWAAPNVPHWSLWLAVALQVVTYAGTSFWWGAGQAKLKILHLPDGSIDPRYFILVNTNWIRVFLISASGILELWMVFKSFLQERTVA